MNRSRKYVCLLLVATAVLIAVYCHFALGTERPSISAQIIREGESGAVSLFMTNSGRLTVRYEISPPVDNSPGIIMRNEAKRLPFSPTTNKMVVRFTKQHLPQTFMGTVKFVAGRSQMFLFNSEPDSVIEIDVPVAQRRENEN